VICRVCKKRPVPDRNKAREDEHPVFTEALAERRRITDSMCYECSQVFSSARLDQILASMKEKARLGQCIVKDCTEPRTATERCAGHQALFDAS